MVAFVVITKLVEIVKLVGKGTSIFTDDLLKRVVVKT